jgi:hypothetical protein
VTRRTGITAWVPRVMIIVVLVLVAAGLASSPSPSACATCHRERPFYASWRRSVHGQERIGCDRCHAGEGLVSTAEYRLGSLATQLLSAVGAHVNVPGVVKAKTRACRRCHSLQRSASTSGSLKIDHRTHVEKAHLGCEYCHSGVAHAGVGSLGRVNPRMRLCAGCHKKNMSDCGFCHKSTQALPSVRDGAGQAQGSS